MALIAVFLLKAGFFEIDGFILLLEATALMLIGGAMDLGTSGTGRKLGSMIEKKPIVWKMEDSAKASRRAAVFTLAGVFLFAEALAMAAVTFR